MGTQLGGRKGGLTPSGVLRAAVSRRGRPHAAWERQASYEIRSSGLGAFWARKSIPCTALIWSVNHLS